jgi:hypothetical protein
MAITYEWSFPNFECDSENKVRQYIGDIQQ